MPTQLQLVNRCLSELGRLPVANINESPDAQAANAKLLELVSELYLLYNWTFLVKYIFDNTPLTTNFSPDYTYSYQLPSDYGHFFKWQATSSQWPIYMITDGMMLAQTKPIGYYYIVNQAAPEVYTPLFARALVLYAAAKLCPTLTNNVELAKYLDAQYALKIKEAILQDNMQQSISGVPYNDYNRVTFV